MRRGLMLAVVYALVVAAGCKTQGTGPSAGNQLSQVPLSGPANGKTAPTAVTDELSGKPAAALCLTMAESLERQGKDADAILYYERVRQLDPSLNDKASRRLAVLYDKTDQQAKALIEFQDLLKKRPKDSSLLNDVGYSYYNRGQWTEAEINLRLAVAADKTNKRAWVNLGMTMAQLGQPAEALAAFEKAVSPAEAHANLAFVLTSQGHKAEAVAAYRTALTLEPMHPIARAALAKLERDDAAPAGGTTVPEPVKNGS